MNCEHFAFDFFCLVSKWEELRDDKMLACCLFKNKLQNPRVTLFCSVSHTQFYEFAFMHKNLRMWRDRLTTTSWVRWLWFCCWKKNTVYNQNLVQKRVAATNLLKPHARTCHLCSIFQQGSSKFKLYHCSWGVRFTPEAQIADTYLQREINGALKASDRCDFDTRSRTVSLWLKSSLPVLPRPPLNINGPYGCPPGSCATSTWSEEAHPWVLKMRPRSVSPFPCNSYRPDLPQMTNSLLLLAGAPPPTLLQQIVSFKNQKKKPFFIAKKSTKSGCRPCKEPGALWHPKNLNLHLDKTWEFSFRTGVC